MTSAPRSTDQAAADSHARLSHLRARLTALTRMTADYASDLGAVLGYDTSDGCIRLHRVTCRRFIFVVVVLLLRWCLQRKTVNGWKNPFRFSIENLRRQRYGGLCPDDAFPKVSRLPRGCLFPVRNPHIRTDGVGCSGKMTCSWQTTIKRTRFYRYIIEYIYIRLGYNIDFKLLKSIELLLFPEFTNSYPSLDDVNGVCNTRPERSVYNATTFWMVLTFYSIVTTQQAQCTGE